MAGRFLSNRITLPKVCAFRERLSPSGRSRSWARPGARDQVLTVARRADGERCRSRLRVRPEPARSPSILRPCRAAVAARSTDPRASANWRKGRIAGAQRRRERARKPTYKAAREGLWAAHHQPVRGSPGWLLRSNGWTPSTSAEKAYRLDQLPYGLRKPKGHGLIERDVSGYAYRLSSRGVQVALLFLFFPEPPSGAPPQSSTCIVYDLSGNNPESYRLGL